LPPSGAVYGTHDPGAVIGISSDSWGRAHYLHGLYPSRVNYQAIDGSVGLGYLMVAGEDIVRAIFLPLYFSVTGLLFSKLFFVGTGFNGGGNKKWMRALENRVIISNFIVIIRRIFIIKFFLKNQGSRMANPG
jgi:Na+/H+-translocating membrane pyrophosphatase